MIVVFVRMIVKPGTEEECTRLSRKMTEESRKEAGCVQYATYQSRENSRCFAVYEQYVDQVALDVHRTSPHFERYIRDGVYALIESSTFEVFVPLS
ncbi:MAG: putative quinol monooxygenase [Candidatus Korobacteraceae bacterium]|jgi:quinol monooxygenase YgiN